jgi:hypothetical protein
MATTVGGGGCSIIAGLIGAGCKVGRALSRRGVCWGWSVFVGEAKGKPQRRPFPQTGAYINFTCRGPLHVQG